MIENDQQLENTRRKRAMLQEALDETQNETDNNNSNNSNAYVRELTLRSLKRRINRMTEEMVRYESQQHLKPTHR